MNPYPRRSFTISGAKILFLSDNQGYFNYFLDAFACLMQSRYRGGAVQARVSHLRL
jgi:hypothetical protein